MQQTKLKEYERTKCEIWTRVMGYHRPISDYNLGKLAEHKSRKFYKEENTKWTQSNTK